MNLGTTFVYCHVMRALLPLLLLPAMLCAQPEPPSFCFVLAKDRTARQPLEGDVQVVQHYRRRVGPVHMSQTWLTPEETMILQAGPLVVGRKHWVVHHPLEGVAESHLLITAGRDTMRIDLPSDASALIDRAWTRWGRNTPEVFHFRKGRYAAEDLVAEPRAEAAARNLAAALIAADAAAYEQELEALEEYYRDQPPPAPPTPPYTPPPPMTEQDWAEYWAEQPPLRQVDIERMNADTVWLRISGRVMLDGGCGSGMPLFGLEMRTDTGWVERLPCSMEQMACGMPWGVWEEQVVMLHPLRWWVSVNSPAATKELLPGTYRLFFMGGNMARVHTAAFKLEEPHR